MYTCPLDRTRRGPEARHGAARSEPPLLAPEGKTMEQPPEPDKGQLDLFEWLVDGYAMLYHAPPVEHSRGMFARFEHFAGEWLTFSHLYDWDSGQWHVAIDNGGLETVHDYDEWAHPL